MPTLLTPVPVETAQLFPRRKRWTRAECATLESAGLFDQRHYELVEGELIDRMGKNSPHVISLALIAIWLRRAFGDLFVLTEPVD